MSVFFFFFVNKLVHYAQQIQTSFKPFSIWATVVGQLVRHSGSETESPYLSSNKWVARLNVCYVRFCKPQIYMDVVETLHLFRFNFPFSLLLMLWSGLGIKKKKNTRLGLEKIQCFGLKYHSWRCLEVSLITSGSVSTNTAGIYPEVSIKLSSDATARSLSLQLCHL